MNDIRNQIMAVTYQKFSESLTLGPVTFLQLDFVTQHIFDASRKKSADYALRNSMSHLRPKDRKILVEDLRRLPGTWVSLLTPVSTCLRNE